MNTNDNLLIRFEKFYPDYARRLKKAQNEEEFNQIHTQIMAEAKENLLKQMHNANLSIDNLGESDKTCCIPLSNETYHMLINAKDDAIKTQLHIILDGLERLKGMEDDDAGLVTAQILLSGALGVGLLSTSTVIAKLAVGAAEAVAAFAGVSVATVGIVCAVATLVIVTVLIPIIYFMQKPANCIVLLINETDQELVFDSDHNHHGKPTLMTSPIQKGISIPGVGDYYVAGLIATEKRSAALYGTQYGFKMNIGSTGEFITYGVECPLTSIYSDNNCYCSFSETAEQAASSTSSKNEQFYEATSGKYKASIKCNSGSGSIAYYIARVYM